MAKVSAIRERVVFPVSVTPAVAGEPVQLSLQAFYAVCNDICVPVQAEVSLELSDATASASDRYTLGLIASEMPQQAAAGDLSVTALTLVDEDGKPALEVALDGVKAPTATDIFVRPARPPICAGPNWSLRPTGQRSTG
jgi:DsbC/DsbD-like thiol-disulfide interchange protein